MKTLKALLLMEIWLMGRWTRRTMRPLAYGRGGCLFWLVLLPAWGLAMVVLAYAVIATAAVAAGLLLALWTVQLTVVVGVAIWLVLVQGGRRLRRGRGEPPVTPSAIAPGEGSEENAANVSDTL